MKCSLIVLQIVWLALFDVNSLLIAQAENYHPLVLIYKESANFPKTYRYELPAHISQYETSLDLYFACPIDAEIGDENLLYIKKYTTPREDSTCESPVRSSIRELQSSIQPSETDPTRYQIGFLITENISQHENTDWNSDNVFVDVVDVLFDDATLSVRSVSYDFPTPPTFLSDESNVNENMTWYNDTVVFGNQAVDTFYNRHYNGDSYKFVKRALVSVHDFRDQNYREVVHHDAVTAPMHRDLENDWTTLEKFLSDVASLLDNVSIETGTGYTNESRHYLNEEAKKVRIPDFFWKAFVNYSPDAKFSSQGVLLVMHNHPDGHSSNRICESSAQNQWLPDYVRSKFSNTTRIYDCDLNMSNVVSMKNMVLGLDRFSGSTLPLTRVSITNEAKLETHLNVYEILKSNYQTNAISLKKFYISIAAFAARTNFIICIVALLILIIYLLFIFNRVLRSYYFLI